MFLLYHIPSKWASCLLLVLMTPLLGAASAGGDDHPANNEGLHFSHPLISESPTPDTKVRIDYALAKETAEEDALVHRAVLEGEYAPVRWLSLEFDLPFSIADRDEEPNRHNVDNLEVALKLASFLLEDEGIIFGGGLELGLPTGNSDNDIGSDRLVEIEPFVDMGIKWGSFEGVGFLKLGFPANANSDDPDWELGWNASLLYHVTPWLQTVLEFDGELVMGGEEDGEKVVHISPGLKVTPLEGQALAVGSAISLPITNDEEFDLRWVFSVFYHF